MRRILVWRYGGDEPYGEIQLDGDRVVGTDQVTEEMVAGSLGAGLSPAATFDRYVDWSNGYVIAREVST